MVDGSVKWQSGERYDGLIDTQGKFDGKGTLHIDNQNESTGFFKDGLLNGFGVKTIEGKHNSGIFRQGELNGPGCTLQNENGEYRGPCREGKPHGKGVFSFNDGGFYTGNFKFGK